MEDDKVDILLLISSLIVSLFSLAAFFIFKCLYAHVAKQNNSHIISNFTCANTEERHKQTAEVDGK